MEQEAHNFVTGFGSIAISSATGKPHDNADFGGGGRVPDPTETVFRATEAKEKADGETGAVKKVTKLGVEEAMWEKARPVMQMVGEAADAWERFGK